MVNYTLSEYFGGDTMTILECPICGQGTLKKEIKNEVFEYGGSSITIPDYIVYRCNVCHRAIVDNETLKSSGHIMKAFQREADARRL
jgi:YgiT-type zinc finger domain-containing protein